MTPLCLLILISSLSWLNLVTVILLAVLTILAALIGAQKLAKIRENSNFFRSELQKMGFEVLGDNDSPVMPIMLYNPAKIPAFSRECLKQQVCFDLWNLEFFFST